MNHSLRGKKSMTNDAIVPPPEVKSYLERLREKVERALDRACVFGEGCPKRLAEAIRYSLLAPGKRLRPVLALAASELCGGEADKAVPAACAVEMIHAYSLIHDDLPSMDDDDLRRGKPTCHKQFDEPTAILAGDALQAMAFEALGRLESDELTGRCTAELAFASGPCRLVGGQMDDISREKRLGEWREVPQVSREVAEKIHLRKTGALMRVALRMGGIVAGADETQLAELDKYGIHYGLVFQITDDLLDVLGDEEAVGKRLRKDADKEKWSYPALIGVEASQEEARNFTEMGLAALNRLDDGWESLPGKTLRYLLRSLLGREK